MAHQILEEFVTSDWWGSLPDADKRDVIEDILARSRQAGRGETIGAYPGLAGQIVDEALAGR